MTATGNDARQKQLRKILDSAELGGSRQSQEFLAYAAEAAFQGRMHLEQIEIAEHVLRRGKDFNPLDDASVRKLATLTRQRLDAYYAGPGAHDPIVVTLPVRSYVPVFREKEIAAAPVLPALPPEAPPVPVRGNALYVLLAIAGVAALAVLLWPRATATKPPYPVFLMRTVKGDVMHDRNDLPPEGIQLGAPLPENGEATVRMTFTPEQARQQAGLLIWDGADHYVKLGRQFQSRPHLEFGIETNGRYHKGPETFQYDPDAQTGQPVWLSIRRNGSTQFTGWISRDGMDWKQVGGTLESPVAMKKARIGIFAHNGRADAASIEAAFDHLSTGVVFQRSLAITAPECYEPEFAGTGLLLRPQSDSVCHSTFRSPVPAAVDWDVSTRLDFAPEDGALAGLNLRGSKGELRLIRWDINGPTITLEQLGHSQVSRADFPGSPPVILRLSARNGRVRGSYSRDDRTFVPLEGEAALRDLGDDPRIGIQAGNSTWTKRRSVPPNFQWLRFHTLRLDPYR